jgi:23S rRNA pseudouridine2604 synthase
VRLAVTDLVRIRIGLIHLDALPEGKWRPLSAQERAALVSGG